jgi:DNA topoisomerase-1
MEPPSLFRGRGAHPKTGKLKQRCMPESVMLNLAEDACVPICSLPGHAWESVRHDPTVTWLCGWQENIQQQNKYVMLAASSSFKGQSDVEKYGKAIRLKAHIHKIRADYTAKIRGQQSKDVATRQLGVAMWVIDTLALRVGGEKGEDEADTVGCCSLRVEHLTFHSDDPNSFAMDLEFLGKDSMLFKQTIQFAQYGDLGKQVYAQLKLFCQGKTPSQDVFETLDPPKLNAHLSSLMKGLTAKVFRTYNASVTLEKELPSAEELAGLSIQEKVVRYNAANREVAILCNHQRTVSKATETMFETLQEKLQILQTQKAELIQWKEWLAKPNNKSSKKVPLLDDDSDITEAIKRQLQQAEDQRANAKTNEDKLRAAQALEDAKLADKQEKKRRLATKHSFKQMPTVESVEARIQKWSEAIRTLEVDIRNREENKEVALGTSKINYMDPRISVAWCKRCEVPIDKIFARTLRDKFNWAMAVPPEWKFE